MHTMKNLLLFKSKHLLYISNGSEDNQMVHLLGTLFDKVFFSSTQSAIDIYNDLSPDIILIDIPEAHKKSLKFIERVRQYNYHMPIVVMLSHDIQEILLDIINLSIDALLYAPLNYEFLTDALSNALKRNHMVSGLITLDNNLVFNIASKKLYLNGSAVTLGAKENQLLLLLIKNNSRTLTKEEIEKVLWPTKVVGNSAVKITISRIRQKIQSDIILPVRGIGYRLNIQKAKKVQQHLKSA
jgi:DNA-binding response OmpR family regulator